MSTQTLLYIIGFFALQFVIAVFYGIRYNKKKKLKRIEANKRNLALYNDPNIAKVAIWIGLELVNGKPFDESIIYYSKVKSNITGLMETIDVALFTPGEYQFLVHSREYSNVTLNVVIEAGKAYQLGANDQGPYFYEELDPNRYIMAEFN